MEHSNLVMYRIIHEKNSVNLLDNILLFFSFCLHVPLKLVGSVNCLDRHVAKDPSAVAIIWEKNKPGQQEEITYKYV